MKRMALVIAPSILRLTGIPETVIQAVGIPDGAGFGGVKLDLGNEAQQVQVVLGEPKTAKARRQIDLPPLAVEALKRHRIHQLKEQYEAVPLWASTDFVFTNSLGKQVDPDNLRHRSFGPLLRRAGLPSIRFHDLRHTAATLLLGLDIRPKVVQELLGHSQISVTMDVYSHVLPTMQREAMNNLDRLLRT